MKIKKLNPQRIFPLLQYHHKFAENVYLVQTLADKTSNLHTPDKVFNFGGKGGRGVPENERTQITWSLEKRDLAMLE